ncbi:MAG: alpha/beta hydrolase, partial [Deltaproteobacteria bacterium]
MDALQIDKAHVVGHSMGGLVVRSACHYARASENRWLARVRRVFCLGAPHHGAPLEKFSNAAAVALSSIDAPGTIVTARLLNERSAGIKDLRYGNVVDEDWLGRDPDALLEDNRRHVPLLDDVSYYFVSATITRDAAHPLGQLLGDLLVRVPSASGPSVTHGAFRIETRDVGRVMHHQLQNHPDVYEVVRSVCAGERTDTAPLAT